MKPVTDKVIEDKVPIIRLKLKVSSANGNSASTSAGADVNVNNTKVNSTSTSDSANTSNTSTSVNEDINLINTNDSTDTTDTAVTGKSIDTLDTTIHSSPSSTRSTSSTRCTTSSSSSSSFYGTFKYRPFKLFPLLPPSSRYRVLIPSKYSHPLNPALKLNYLWQPAKLLGSSGIYTDDSDLVCVLVKEGWVKDLEVVKGKNLLVEVEVISFDDVKNQDQGEQVNNVKDLFKQPAINARSYEGHDGHYIRVITCTVDPSAVHLKHWRKPKPPPASHHLVTPNFKTKSQS